MTNLKAHSKGNTNYEYMFANKERGDDQGHAPLIYKRVIIKTPILIRKGCHIIRKGTCTKKSQSLDKEREIM